MSTIEELGQELRDLLHAHPKGTHFCVKEQKEGWAPSGELLIKMLDGYERRLAIAKSAISDLLDCPMWVDEATVPKAGIDTAPEQVVFNASIGLLKIRAARKALEQIGETNAQ